MTVRELTVIAQDHLFFLTIFFVALPALAALLGSAHGPSRGGLAPWKHLYSLIVYLVCVPGVFASVITAYTLFFTRENLLDVNAVVYFAPIVSMIVTLVIISKRVSFDEIPGFDRLSGLITALAVTFVFALALRKTRIWLVFGDSVLTLAVIVVVLFGLLRWGARTLFRSGDEPQRRPPWFHGP
jgi:hypothetical protein